MRAAREFRQSILVLGGMVLAALLFGSAGPAGAGAASAPEPGTARAAAKITPEQATAIALKAMPGKATDVTIEKKRGKNVYVVEVMTESRGEQDVLVDMVSGKVLGTE